MLLCLQGLAHAEKGQCIWYDKCGWDIDYGPDGGHGVHFLNCHYDGPAKPATAQQIELVKEVCPHLYTEGEELNLCCSLKQLQDLKDNFVTPQLLIEPNCPTCYYNFKKNFCDMTCSDQQNKFVRADHIVQGPGFDFGDTNYTGQTVSMVKDVTYFVNDQFVTDVFDSCKNVQFPPFGSIMYMLCGQWGEEYCSPHRWFNFFGSVDNGYSPFQVSYQYSEDNEPLPADKEYHNPDILSCSEIAPGYTSACGCTDCPDACKQNKWL